MDCMETNHNNPAPHKSYHIVAWFNFAKMFLDKENCFWE